MGEFAPLARSEPLRRMTRLHTPIRASTRRQPVYILYLCIGALTSTASALCYLLLSRTSRSPLRVSLAPLRPVLLALAAAVPGTQTLILAKCLSEMIVYSLGRKSQLGHWYFWTAATLPLLTAGVWMGAMQYGLSAFPTVVILPVLQVRALVPATSLLLMCATVLPRVSCVIWPMPGGGWKGQLWHVVVQEEASSILLARLLSECVSTIGTKWGAILGERGERSNHDLKDRVLALNHRNAFVR
jgi:hypothetical protein